jgi:DNA-binding FadR family transcriptional regulator
VVVRLGREPFGVALATVRARLREGRYARGDQLMITALAEELGLSATPVREALAWLAGEGLIEDRRGMGYFAWRPDAVDLIQILDLQQTLLNAALSYPADPAAAFVPLAQADYVSQWEHAFEHLLARSGNLLLMRLLGGVADRLAPVRRVEARVLSGSEAELAELQALLARNAAVSPTWLAEHHSRRMDAAPALVAAVRASAQL